MEVSEIIEYRNYNEFVENIPFFNKGVSIYRGQANEYDDREGKTKEWKLTPSFSRYFGGKVSFDTFIGQHIQKELFQLFFSDYKYEKINELSEASQIEKIYFFQHYGIPTCFIDFTKNPFIALYFAIAGIKYPSVKKFNNNRSITSPDDLFFTIWQLRSDLLKKYFRIKELSDISLSWSINECLLDYVGYEDYKVCLDLNPVEKLKVIDNYNLKKQEGVFLLFDNSRTGLINKDFEDLLNSISQNLGMEISEGPIIIKHRIYYNSLHQLLRDGKKGQSILQYLQSKNISGKTLFNDIQGLRYDILNFL